jgi:hypothetical protein
VTTAESVQGTGLKPSRAARGIGPGRLRHILRHPVVAATLAAGLLHLLWALFLATGGGDLAAQDAWADFVNHHPDSAYNLAWYGGMHPFSYSVISPYLMALLGVRTVAVVSGTLSAGLVAFLLMRAKVAKPLPPALWGAFALSCNAASGRVTFALGVLFALMAMAVVFVSRGHRMLRAAGAVGLGALATLSSPVAGLFIEVVAAALFLTKRRPPAYALAVGPVAVVAGSALLFPFRGMQPMPWFSVILPAGIGVAVAALAPKGWRTVRVAAGVYALGVILSWVIPSEVGTNVDRLSLLFGGVVLLAMAATRPKATVIYLVFAVTAVWTVAKPVRDIVRTAPAASWSEQAAPLISELGRLHADRGRVEVVPEASHTEASSLAPYVNLARGWNRQLDVDRHPLFYDGTLSPATYHAWLRVWAVRYVVLPAAEPDEAAEREAKIVQAGQPWLKPVWQDPNWVVYRVTDPLPLAEGPATVRKAGPEEITIEVHKAGPVMVRVPWSPWLSILNTRTAAGCLTPKDAPTEGKNLQWTTLHAPGPGEYRLGARYKMPRGTPC